MNCVCLTSFSILINDSKRNQFSVSRGVEVSNKDALSLFLFIIYIEGFSTLIEDVVSRAVVEDLQVTRRASSVSHLFFANNSLLFMKIRLLSAISLGTIIKKYEATFDQVINFHKSSLYFSLKLSQSLYENKGVFGINVVSHHPGCLGLPSIIPKNRRDIFSMIYFKVIGVVNLSDTTT